MGSRVLTSLALTCLTVLFVFGPFFRIITIMDNRFYNSSDCMSRSSNSSPEAKHQGRAITGAHHFEKSSNVRRPLFQLEETSPVQRAPQTLFWQSLPSMQPIMPMPNNNVMQPRVHHHHHPPIRGQFEPQHPRPQYGIRPGRECKFCRNNGESRDQYSSHVLRNPQTGQLICPVLRSHICEMCGATGDKAHTRNYCPKVKEDKKNKYAIPVILKKTMRQSDGQMRQ